MTLSTHKKNYIEHKNRLLELKELLFNQMISLKADFDRVDKSKGDESDRAVAHQEEHAFLVSQTRCKRQLLEIDSALSRIENGTYGFCEITQEPIEKARLLAIPWTRYSIEGAEIQQENLKNDAHKIYSHAY